ncbi:hypothetical protein CVT25_009045, partial [Psilocybe cyanescens]
TQERIEHEAGPSSKSKGVDPRNWGSLDIPENELNLDVQRAIEQEFEDLHTGRHIHYQPEPTYEPEDDDNEELRRLQELKQQYLNAENAYLNKRQVNEHSKYAQRRGISSTPMSHDVEELISHATRQRVQARKSETIRPSNQLPPESLLGQFFHKLRTNMDANLGAHQIGPLDIEGNTTTVTRYKPLLPTSPDKYHGNADFMKFYKYITQCERFCKEAALPPRDQVVKCADYLSGKAYKFYSTMVSISVEHCVMFLPKMEHAGIAHGTTVGLSVPR